MEENYWMLTLTCLLFSCLGIEAHKANWGIIRCGLLMKFVIEALYLGQRIEIYERIEFFSDGGYATNICIILNFLFLILCCLLHSRQSKLNCYYRCDTVYISSTHNTAPRGYKIWLNNWRLYSSWKKLAPCSHA